MSHQTFSDKVLDDLDFHTACESPDDCGNDATLYIEGRCPNESHVGRNTRRLLICDDCWTRRELKVVTCRCGYQALIIDFWHVLSRL